MVPNPGRPGGSLSGMSFGWRATARDTLRFVTGDEIDCSTDGYADKLDYVSLMLRRARSAEGWVPEKDRERRQTTTRVAGE
jgi:hypothetical protein